MRRASDGDAQKIGNEHQQRLRVGRAEVAVERGELVLFCAAGVEIAHVAHKDHLERRHERGRLRAVEDFEDGGGCKIEIGEAEVSELVREQKP